MIILVEDDDGFRSALVSMLSVCGFRVLAFATAERARDSAAWDDAACLVADIRLPGISGFDLLRWLRRSGHGLPAIVITAASSKRARDEAAALGVAAYLEKPVHGRRLVTAIRKAISS
jgi:FixJ family two-component response regulator